MSPQTKPRGGLEKKNNDQIHIKKYDDHGKTEMQDMQKAAYDQTLEQ